MGDIENTSFLPGGVTVAFDGGMLQVAISATRNAQFTLSNQGGIRDQGRLNATCAGAGAYTDAVPARQPSRLYRH